MSNVGTYTADEVAEMLQLHRETVYIESRRGNIPGRIKIGKAVRFRKAAIDALLNGE